MPNLEKRADCINLLLSKASKYMLAPSSRCVFSSLPLIGCSGLPIVSSVKNHSTSLFPPSFPPFRPSIFLFFYLANSQRPTANSRPPDAPSLRLSLPHIRSSDPILILYSSYTHPILILYLSYTFPYPRTPAFPRSRIPPFHSCHFVSRHVSVAVWHVCCYMLGVGRSNNRPTHQSRVKQIKH